MNQPTKWTPCRELEAATAGDSTRTIAVVEHELAVALEQLNDARASRDHLRRLLDELTATYDDLSRLHDERFERMTVLRIELERERDERQHLRIELDRLRSKIEGSN
jgi:chromosome segregation ATPase